MNVQRLAYLAQRKNGGVGLTGLNSRHAGLIKIAIRCQFNLRHIFPLADFLYPQSKVCQKFFIAHGG